jgi:hypothetical protein
MHHKHLVVASFVALVASCPIVAAQTVPPQDPVAELRLDLAQCRVDREAGERRVKQLEEQLRLAGDVEQLVRRLADAESRVSELENEKAGWLEQVRSLRAEVARLQEAARNRSRSSPSRAAPPKGGGGGSGPYWAPGPITPWTNPAILPPAPAGQPAPSRPPGAPSSPGVAATPSSGAPTTPSGPMVERTRVDGRLDDLRQGTLLRMASGSVYEVTESVHLSVSRSDPEVTVHGSGSSVSLTIDGVDKPVRATLITRGLPWSVPGTPERVESFIRGRFDGFARGRLFSLANGDIWEQTDFRTTVATLFNPDVTIVRDGRDHRMAVKGASDSVSVKRVK